MCAHAAWLHTTFRLGQLSAAEWLLVALGLVLIVVGLPALAPLG